MGIRRAVAVKKPGGGTPFTPADILPERDEEVNALGIKGVGELGNVGLNAATADAVYHAAGVRIRELPIRIEKLLTA